MPTILVVEDEGPIREFLGELLAEEGYAVLRAEHGAQALDLIAAGPPDLVLTDLMMPVMNGTELCRRLRSDAATRDVPIIAMSAAGRQQAAAVGADAFLNKPFELNALLELVERYLDGRHE